MNSILSKEIFENQTKHIKGRLLEARQWRVNEMSHPILDVTFLSSTRRPLRIKMKCDRYDELPASIEILSEDGSFLMKPPTGTNVINVGAHSVTGRPFICSPGSFEYHTHSGHTNDLWENYKNKSDYDLGGMLTQIHNAWSKTTDVP